MALPRRTRERRPRRRASVAGVFGEILITLGVIVLLYVVWQMWVGDMIYGAQANAEGAAMTEQWDAEVDALSIPEPASDPEAVGEWEPPLITGPTGTEDFATMLVPRFGADYSRPIAGGVTRAGTLDRNRIGLYPDAAMPGQPGNFSLAAHRTTWGAPFGPIADLQLGDAIVVETAEGWYTYRFRTLEYVVPTQVDVLLDVPQRPETPMGERYITLTSCSPKFSLAERIVAYGVFDSFQPRAEGPPASLTEGVS